MKKHRLWYTVILALGIGSGAVYGLWSAPFEEFSISSESKRERFFVEREVLAFQGRDHDFFSALNSSRVNYQGMLSHLLQRDVDYGSVNVSKLSLLFSLWGYSSPVQAMDALERIPFKHRGECRTALFDGWSKRDPEAVARYYEENRESLYRTDVLAITMRNWAKTSPEGAIEFLSSLNTKEEKLGFSAVLDSVQTNHPELLSRIVSLLSEKMLEDDSFLNDIMQQWTKADSEAALKWMSTLPDDKQELLSKYKELKSLPSLDSLVELSQHNPDDLSPVIEKYPKWLQADAWAIVLTGIADRKGKLEMTRWKEEHVPEELTAGISESKMFHARGSAEEGNQKIYEEMMTRFPGKSTPGDFMVDIASTYRDKFSARKPDEYLSIIAERQGKNSTLLDSEVFERWLYDQPEKAQAWMDRMSETEMPEVRDMRLRRAKVIRPAMAIDKKR